MSHHAETQLLMGALSTMGQLAASQQRHGHARAIEELRAANLAHLIDALVTRKVDAVKSGFLVVLEGYAEQARHFMGQQQKYADAELLSADPLARIELRNRIQDIDLELSTIRIDAKLLYATMTEIIRAIGGAPDAFASAVAQPLAFGTIIEG